MDDGPTSALAKRLGARYAIFGFSHDWEVVAAVSAAGGCGVLGTNRHRPASLADDLVRIEERVGDAPYGVNLLVPRGRTEQVGTGYSPLPDDHVDFVRRLCDELGVPVDGGPAGPDRTFGAGSMTMEHAMALWEVCRRVSPRVVSVGLGTPPAAMMDQARDMGSVRVALAGSRRHALRLRDEGFDCVVAQGNEAAGHTGTVGTFVLVPEVVEAVGALPVLAAGGVVHGQQIAAAEALGAAGVWIGSALLTTEESAIPAALKDKLLAADSGQTYRTRALSGKPSRQLRNELLDAWERQDAPPPLPSPMQGRLMQEAVVGGLETGDARLMVTPAGQGIGLLSSRGPVAALIQRLVTEYDTTVQRLGHLPRGCSPP